MVNTEAFAAINIDQLVTATDRLVFGIVRRQVPRRIARGSGLLDLAAADEPTIYVRGPSMSSYRSSVVILAVAASLTWLAVAVICLLA
jgi:hypothetical protein